jgi:hypothetical protein
VIREDIGKQVPANPCAMRPFPVFSNSAAAATTQERIRVSLPKSRGRRPHTLEGAFVIPGNGIKCL